MKMTIKPISDAIQILEGARNIVTSMAAAEPKEFFTYLSNHPELFSNRLRIYCANPSTNYPCFNPSTFPNLEFVVMFLTAALRKCTSKNFHYFPHHLSNWADLISVQPVDVFWGSCSMPDQRGFVTLGPGCCYESEILQKAKYVVLEMNPNIPITFGSTCVPIRDVDVFVEANHPLPSVSKADVSDIDQAIANFVADITPDGATLQLGIGGIPNALGKALEHKKDLGVHTEMINDTMMELYLKGAITGKKKSRWPLKMVGAFAFGSKELYQFINMNPMVELHPASVVNDPYRIAQNFQMTSINTAVEIDLTGQVCSESVGHRELSGVGGASETHLGAQRSKNGRGIIAMNSTMANGDMSKIVFELKPGAKVSISRNDVDTIVTEYGVAHLRGKTVQERVESMINLAHPKFRDELRYMAKKVEYI